MKSNLSIWTRVKLDDVLYASGCPDGTRGAVADCLVSEDVHSVHDALNLLGLDVDHATVAQSYALGQEIGGDHHGLVVTLDGGKGCGTTIDAITGEVLC